MKRIALLAMASAFLLSAMIVTSSAQERKVGVAKGNWFKYGTIETSWNVINPNATFPISSDFYEKLDKMEWMLLSVEDISGTNITYQITEHYKDGTENTYTDYIDIDIGYWNNLRWMIISSDLNVNDTAYSEQPFIVINDTVLRQYPDGSRYANHFHGEGGASWVKIENNTYWINETVDVYWDRSTGILVEESFEEFYYLNDELVKIHSGFFRITELNAWAVPEFPTMTMLLIGLAVSAVVIVVCVRSISKRHAKAVDRVIAG